MGLNRATDEPWASVEDLEARWRTLTESERVRAEALLADAQSLVKDECPMWERSSFSSRRRVVCAIVRRAMNTPSGSVDASGVSQTSMTAGPYSQSFTFANPGGDLYMTKSERRSVGGRSGAFEIDLLGDKQ